MTTISEVGLVSAERPCSSPNVIEPGVHRFKCSDCQHALYIFIHIIASINEVSFAAEIYRESLKTPIVPRLSNIIHHVACLYM